MPKLLCKLIVLLVIVFALDTVTWSVLKSGTDKYYGLDKEADVFYVGNSRIAMALDAPRMEKELGVHVANHAIHGFLRSDFQVLLAHYLSQCRSKPKVVLYSLDIDSLTGAVDNLGLNQHMLVYPYLDDPLICRYLQQHEKSLQDLYLRKYLKTLRFNSHMLNIAVRGHRNGRPRYSGTLGKAELERRNEQTKKADAQFNSGDARFDRGGVTYLEEAIRLVRSKGIKLVFLYLPDVDVAITARQQRNYDELMRILDGYCRKDGGITVISSTKPLEKKHDLFLEVNHVNESGEKAITGEVIKVLRTLI